ncbi:ankyrin-3 [Caerostris darwini]|uniref:Ankyrin-3 n=1 Tax=Caerostris darwini TaxID=1538125 RepID=A0AAV4NDF9_9ARAC|nr:ankyrin-3 [Caerostris darwini]
MATVMEGFLTNLLAKSEDELVTEFCTCNEEGKERIYLTILFALQKVILQSDTDILKKISLIFNIFKNEISEGLLLKFYENINNPFKITNPVILCCKQGNVEIIKLLFEQHASFCNLLSKNSIAFNINPTDVDEDCHNAFYYAMRSAKTELLQYLINSWPGISEQNLDKILSDAYNELRLRNVAVPIEMHVVIRYHLIKQRFFNETGDKSRVGVTMNVFHTFVEERINVLLEDIKELAKLSNVDEVFLFRAKFIVKNIHVLKRKLRCTYDKLPWEEIEFYTIIFISCREGFQRKSLFYNAIVSRNRILQYLKDFAICLSEETPAIIKTDEKNLIKFPKGLTKHSDAVSEILKNRPCFSELFNDFKQIRDLYSLEIIKDYLDCALSADAEENEGKLTITRALQVIGEHIKNTLETPKLSDATGKLLLYSLPISTRDAIVDLRNALSHAESLAKRSEIKPNNEYFFSKIQNDFIKLHSLVSEILCKIKTRVIVALLNKIFECTSLEDMKETISCFNLVEANEVFSRSPVSEELEQLENFMQDFRGKISSKTHAEEVLFEAIDFAITSEKNKTANVYIEFLVAFNAIYRVLTKLKDSKNNETDIEFIKNKVDQSLLTVNMMTAKVGQSCIKEVGSLLECILINVGPRMSWADLDEVTGIAMKVFYILEYEVSNIKWIEEFRHKLKPDNKKKKTKKENGDYKLFFQTLNTLEKILEENGLMNNLIKKLPSYKSDKNFQTIIEMLVLDAFSVLRSEYSYLTDNPQFLENNPPTLIGKNLRNHLAHSNAVNDVLEVDVFLDTTLNAWKIVAEVTMAQSKKIDKVVQNVHLEETFQQHLDKIIKQKELFSALVKGDNSTITNCLRTGADLHGRDLNLWTALHFASKGPCLEVVKFVLSKNIDIGSKDVSGMNSLHVASCFGRADIVEFFLKDQNMSPNEETRDGMTPLDLAIRHDHKNVVEALLKNNASIQLKRRSHAPMRYAVWYNRKDIVEIILGKEWNIDASVTMGGFTSLHIAAERGHTDLVNFLLTKNANVRSKSDERYEPLHLASMNGEADIVRSLLSKGADSNAETLEGRTPLSFAAEMGRTTVSELLVEHKANVNVADKTTQYSPLILSVKTGNLDTVEFLLGNQACVDAQDFLGQTSLHFAAMRGHVDMTCLLLRNRADISVVDSEGKTALHKAAERNHEEVVKILIQNRANFNAIDKYKKTPLHRAAENGYLAVVEVLVKAGAIICAKDASGSTSLHLSTQQKHVSVTKYLTECGSSIYEPNLKMRSPLHLAIESCNEEMIQYFIGKVNIADFKSIEGSTLLHLSALYGNKKFVEFLIEGNFLGKDQDIKVRDDEGKTVFHLAAEGNQLEIIKLLIDRKLNLSFDESDWKDLDGHTPLYYAIRNNYKEIVRKLVKAGISSEKCEYWEMAITYGYKDILDILWDNCTNDFINEMLHRLTDGLTLLHLATINGHLNIMETLLLKGADKDAITLDNMSALHFAAKLGHAEIVELLVSKKANPNIKSVEGLAPLHFAVKQESMEIVEILLKGGADPAITDGKNQTAAEIGVEKGNLEIVKILLQNRSSNQKDTINTVLHTAASKGDLEIVKYLISENADINYEDSAGHKPIHTAAKAGHKDIVELLFRENESSENITLLHLAVLGGHLDLIKYLIDRKINLNATGCTPVHLAAENGYRNIVELLLNNGAYFDSLDSLNRTPLDLAQDDIIVRAFNSTKKLFTCEIPLDIEDCVEEGAFVNAKKTNGFTSLHFAAWKGYEGKADFLIRNGANPDIIGKKGSSPLHYASKFSHLGIVKTLLSNGATYNMLDESKKTPFDYAENEDIKRLLSLLDQSFQDVQVGSSRFLRELRRVTRQSIRCFMCSKNREGKTLVVAAICSDFPQIEKLKNIQQDDALECYKKVDELMEEEKFKESLKILDKILQKRKDVLGLHNPGCSEVEEKIAMVLYKQQNYAQALHMLEKIYLNLKREIHIETEDTLRIRSFIAMIYHAQGENNKALTLIKEVEEKMERILGGSHEEYLRIQFHKAIVLDALGKCEEALAINYEIYEKYRQRLGDSDKLTLTVRNNIGIVLRNLGRNDEALRIFGIVYEGRKHVLGNIHSDTLRTLHNLIGVLSSLGKWEDAHRAYQDILNRQIDILGRNHLDTLRTKTHIGDLLFSQEQYLNALKIYLENLDDKKKILGPNHAEIIETEGRILAIYRRFVLDGLIGLGRLNQMHEIINQDMDNDSRAELQKLISMGFDVNRFDSKGLSLLHVAVENDEKEKVSLLLENGANVFQMSAEGHTPLHTAAQKGLTEIAEILLRHAKDCHLAELDNFLNTKTVAEGNTPLHVAANTKTAKILLRYGAIYNIQNSKGQRPVDLAKNQDVIFLLRLVDRVFTDAERCNSHLIAEFGMLMVQGFSAVFFAKNREKQTLLEVAVAKENKVLECLLSGVHELHKVQITFND